MVPFLIEPRLRRKASLHNNWLSCQPLDASALRTSVATKEVLLHYHLPPFRLAEAALGHRQTVQVKHELTAAPLAYALVPGGWLPCEVANVDNLMLDTNIAGSFSMSLPAERKKLAAGNGLHGQLQGSRWVHGWPAAMEIGPKSSTPPPFEVFADKLRDVFVRLSNAFGARAGHHHEAIVPQLYGVLLRQREIMEQSCLFLSAVVPLLTAWSASTSGQSSGYKQLLSVAARLGVSPTGVIALLATDCIFDKGPGTPRPLMSAGRLVLKPTSL